MECQIFWLRLQHLEVLVQAPEKFGPKTQKKRYLYNALAPRTIIVETLHPQPTARLTVRI